MGKYWIGLTLSLAIVQLIYGQISMPERRINLAVKSDPNLSYRLPNNTKPEEYDITLTTNIHKGEFEFQGLVKITILAVETSTNITLHHRQLNITSVKLLTTSDEPDELLTDLPIYDKDTELLQIDLKSPFRLDEGQRYTLEINYEGILRGDEAGFYRSSYKDAEGNTRWLATTQFEQTDARHAFPCYDEPALKAKFTIRIKHDKSYNAISNMPETRTENSDTTATTSFAETPKTSSYLIAFIVSDFPNLTNSKRPFEHRTFAKPTAIDQTKLALEAGEKILDGIGAYLRVPFHLPKMDQAAIPDFAAGAMENWGLVTYRESAFFWIDAVSKFTQRQQIYSIIAHEFAHQWFGNVVSPQWWSFIWLNEGFANYFGNKGVDVDRKRKKFPEAVLKGLKEKTLKICEKVS